MSAKEMDQEQISAFADGELSRQQVDIVLAALRQGTASADWEMYHQIGDVLRSDDMALPLSANFSARMAARLDAEPAILSPQISLSTTPLIEKPFVGPALNRGSAKRWALPSMVAAAAVASIAFFATPQIMVGLKLDGMNGESLATSGSSPGADAHTLVATSASSGVILRDPRIDDYLLAHQHLSHSVYSTAQYARSATFSSK